MNIIATADTHGNTTVLQAFVDLCNSGRFDVGVVAGDVTECWQFPHFDHDFTLSKKHTLQVLSVLNQSQVPVIVVRGNHDTVNFPDCSNVHCVDNKTVTVKGVTFVGEFVEVADITGNIFVTHEPAFGQLHSQTLSKKLSLFSPKLHIHGHYHQFPGVLGNSINAAFPNQGTFFCINTDTCNVSEVPIV